jgi:BioD-like phosphotransacetylase family protein
MKALYITSVESFSGKTAVCLALGHHMQSGGYKVGYLKPVSTQPWRTPEGRLGDEDAVFVHSTLGLDGDPLHSSPIVITPESFRERLTGKRSENLIEVINNAAEEACAGKDILLLEGGASLREGYAIGLSNLEIAKELGAPALVIVSYRGEMRLLDDALAAQFRLGDQLMGAIINQVPEEGMAFINEYALSFLESKGMHVFGVLPRVPRLSALSVGELADMLEADILTEYINRDALAETLTVGAMTAEAALSRFRRYKNKAVITGGDRTDIQLAALETSTTVLILTGNLRPSPLIIRQAEALKVPILLVNQNTMETVEQIENAHGKTRLGQPEKLDTFQHLMEEHVDIQAIYAKLSLK